MPSISQSFCTTSTRGCCTLCVGPVRSLAVVTILVAASRSRSRRTAAHRISHVLAVADETRGLTVPLTLISQAPGPGDRSHASQTHVAVSLSPTRYCPCAPARCAQTHSHSRNPEPAVPFRSNPERAPAQRAHATRRGAVPCIYADAGGIHQHQRTNARWMIPRPLACFCSNEF